MAGAPELRWELRWERLVPPRHWVAVVGKGWPSGTDDLGVASSGRLRLRRGRVLKARARARRLGEAILEMLKALRGLGFEVGTVPGVNLIPKGRSRHYTPTHR